jgi:hypothetical protein
MYYIRLIDDNTKNVFDSLLKSKFLKLVIYNSDKKIDDYEKQTLLNSKFIEPEIIIKETID